jgi:hypothetical protein
VTACPDANVLTLQVHNRRLTLWNDGGPWEVRPSWYSPSYGVKEPTRECLVTLRTSTITWRIDLD